MSASPLRAYLVDDEPLALKRLCQLLCGVNLVEIVGKTTDPEAALAFLRCEPVDVLLLDIQMPGMNGFELLARLPAQPWVIFTTAHDEYALRAFKENSVDYLLKPVEPKELEQALGKVKRLCRSASATELQAQLQAVTQQLAIAFQAQSSKFPERIASRIGSRTHFVELSRVSHFQSRDKLTYAVTPLRQYVVDHTITELEQKLDPGRFVRIHRSTLLNLAWVSDVYSWFGGRLRVKLKGEKELELEVARDRTALLSKTWDFRKQGQP